MTVGEMLTRMSSTEISEWGVYYRIKASEQPGSSGQNARAVARTRDGSHMID